MLSPQSMQGMPDGAVGIRFAHWNPAQYLAHYYKRVESEERHTLRFLVSQLRNLSANSVALEFGVGPTLHHVLPLAARTSEVHVADLLPANLQAICEWQNHATAAHDWSAFTREVLTYEGVVAPTRVQIASRENLTRRRITRYLLADAESSSPLKIESTRRYDCVLSCYCADSATPSKARWFQMMQNIASLVAPGGLFVVAALRRCSYYQVGDIRFPSADIDERDMLAALHAMRCIPSTLELQLQCVPDRKRLGFDGIILAAARLR
jgi:hypothetical protein